MDDQPPVLGTGVCGAGVVPPWAVTVGTFTVCWCPVQSALAGAAKARTRAAAAKAIGMRFVTASPPVLYHDWQ
jgi:hypothetical protein